MKSLGFLIAVLFMFSDAFGQDIVEGEKLFNSNCKACHRIGEGIIVGPDLKEVTKRRKEDWLFGFIKSPSTLIKSGDPEAKALFDEFKVLMPDHAFLTDDKIKSILAFIDSKEAAEVVVEKQEEQPKEDVVKASDEKVLEATTTISTLEKVLYSLIGICFFLVLIAMVLVVRVLKFLNK